MHRVLRIVPCLALLAGTLLAAAPQTGGAQQQPSLIKRFVDGKWRVDSPSVVIPEPSPAAGAANIGPLGSWGRMVFASVRENTFDIFAYTPIPNVLTATNLTRHNANDQQPRLNPSADHVAFVSNRDGNFEIYRMPFAGGAPARLTRSAGSDLQPFWSPDGSRIVFPSQRDGNYELYVMDANGGNQVRLTADGAGDVMPAWSPDGRSIAWIRITGTSGALWQMNADGISQRPITGPLSYLQHPAWSPDGARIAFDYDRDGDGFNDLATIAIDGSDLQPVAFPDNVTRSGQKVDLSAGTWAPPGDWLGAGVSTYNLADLSLFNAYVAKVALQGVQSEPLLFPEYDFQPDIRSLDLLPPITAMRGLPRYTRGTAASIEWSGTDTGVAGNVVYDVQARSGAAGTWTPWRTGTTATAGTYTGTAGSSVAFRVRGRDAAGNAEAWHSASGDAATMFYASRLAGGVTDNRGRPIPAAALAVAPAAVAGGVTSPDGRYLAYLDGTGSYTVSPAHAGYRALPPTTLGLQRDRTFSPYLPPLNDMAQNGDFEASASQLAGWQTGGTLPVGVTSGEVLTGARSALLGAGCALPCLTSRETSTIAQASSAGIAAGADGTLHVVYGSMGAGTRPLFYAARTPDGAWTAPQPLGFNGLAPRIAIDGAGTLHAVWTTTNSGLRYSQRSPLGEWSTPSNLGSASEPGIVVDRQGQAYVAATCWSSLDCPAGTSGFVRTRTASGTWLPAVYFEASRLALAIGPEDRAVVAWEARGSGGLTATLDADGTIGPPLPFTLSREPIDKLRLVVDRSGVRHVFWRLGSEAFYATVEADGELAPPALLPGGDTAAQVAIDEQGTLHALVYNEYGSSGMFYLARRPNGDWSAPTQLGGTGRAAAAMVADRFGRLRILYYDSFTAVQYQESAGASSAGEAALAQSVTVPLGRPTLAFLYRLQGVGAASGSRLDVVVTRNGTATTVLSTLSSDAWTLASADLEPWAGQTVEIALKLQQAAGMPAAAALIDDVSVGSWQTPVIQAITPPSVDAPSQATQLTISGENFLATPTVKLGAIVLPDVQLVDQATLKVTVPAGTNPGRCDLWVFNPGGQATVYPGLVVGKQVALPVVSR